MKKSILFLVIIMLGLFSCTENYSNGERIGVIIRFSRKGFSFKTWEATLNVTQTGMNTSGEPFNISVDRNNEDANLIAAIDSAANLGWKVKVIYHECSGKNIFGTRGETNYFIDSLICLDKNFSNNLQFNEDIEQKVTGKVVDTVYVIIVDKSRLKD